MQIVQSTFIVLVLLGVMLAKGPYRSAVLLFAVTPFGMMAAINLPAVGGMSISAIDMAVLTVFCMVLLRSRAFDDFHALFQPGRTGFWLLMFLIWATFATLFFPRLFAGQTDVFGIGRIANATGIVIRPLGPSGGNLSQLMRIYLSVLAFVALAFVAYRRPDATMFLRAIQVTTIIHVFLGVLDITTNWLNQEWLMAPFRTANYSLLLGHKMAGLNRMIGGFPEASAFGYMSVGLLGFWLCYWFHARRTSKMAVVYLLMSLAVVIRSTSSSAYVGTGLLLAVFVTTQLAAQKDALLSRRASSAVMVSLAMVPLLAMGIVALYQLVPGFSAYIDRALLTKLETDSGVERMGWNLQALKNFWETGLMGAGLGSVRASNWVVSLLATTGLLGAMLHLGFLWSTFRLPTRTLDTETRLMVMALKMGCAGFLARAIVVKGTPNLEIVFYAMAGVAVGLTYAARYPRRSAVPPSPLRSLSRA